MKLNTYRIETGVQIKRVFASSESDAIKKSVIKKEFIQKINIIN